jgi:hypothetical protein
MRKMFCLIVLSTIVSTVFSQPTTSIQTDYLQKSKKQKTAAFVLLGGGAVLAVVGTAIGSSSWDDEIASIVGEGEDDKSYMAGGIMMVTGLAGNGGQRSFIYSFRTK